jgi:hypothetical protein
MQSLNRWLAGLCAIARDRRKTLSVAAAIALAALVSAGDATLAAPADKFGMNYDFLNVDKTALALCASEKGKAAGVKGQAFLVRYQDPTVRQTVLKALSGMRKAGFEGIRVIVWFAGQNDGGRSIFNIDDPSQAAKNVSEFASDLNSLGYSHFYLAFGPQGTAKVACRKVTWGDCFDPRQIDKAVAFILKVRQALDASPHPPLYVDLQNSGAMPSRNAEQMRSNMDRYLSTLVKAYSRQFPHDLTTISIQGRNTGDRSDFVFKVYEEAGLEPSYLDFHIYQSDPASLAQISEALRSARTRLPVVIGEAAYGNPRAVAAISSLLGSYDPEGVPLYFWPLRDIEGDCGVDTAPPYDLTWLSAR